jgi:hypothetical protein
LPGLPPGQHEDWFGHGYHSKEEPVNKISAGIVTATLTLGVLVGTATSASASDVSCAQVVGSGSTFSYRYKDVRNNCGYTITVKLDINNANDSGCYAISPGATVRMRYNRLYGSFRAIIDC